VWLFFEVAVRAALARKLGSCALTETMERRPDIGLDSYDRFFPNQDTLPQGGFGNLIALPLQKQSREPGNSVFVDDRLKADILVVTTHSDDESGVIPYLARAVYEEKRRVAVVFTTDGNSGTNDVGRERAAALGAIREIEARRALASFGIDHVWFLANRDLATQDVLVTLGAWRHAASVEELVRLIRLVRPEVVLTFLPAVVAGENNGNHQATGVLATEAFDIAGDPTAFPSQLAAPVQQYESSLENLRHWQPKKLYYFSDAGHAAFMKGKGPRYSIEALSPSQNQIYHRLVARDLLFHETQFGATLAPTLKRDESALLNEWRYDDTGDTDLILIRGKTLVPGPVDADVMAGIVAGPVPFAAHRGYAGSASEPPTLQAHSRVKQGVADIDSAVGQECELKRADLVEHDSSRQQERHDGRESECGNRAGDDWSRVMRRAGAASWPRRGPRWPADSSTACPMSPAPQPGRGRRRRSRPACRG
jgi:LmbE family N-acetylglucosaminyl deacetylase